MGKLLVSIIVVTYNRAKMLCGALESLSRQETGGMFSFDIIVIDNTSTDNTVFVVKDFARTSKVPVRYILEKNKGVAYARNRGIRESSGDWIAFFDDDQLADPNWLKELLDMTQKVSAFCVGGCIKLFLPQEDLIKLSPICRSILGETLKGDKSNTFSKKTLPGTGNALIKRTVFDTIGNFDESFSRGGEDSDFFRRVRFAGFEIWYAPKAIVYHILLPHRLQKKYLFWASQRHGVNYAYMDYKKGGFKNLILACIFRIGQALLVNLPCLIWAIMVSDRATLIGRECLLWRATGYVREGLFLALPRVFTQKHFFKGLEFRKNEALEA